MSRFLLPIALVLAALALPATAAAAPTASFAFESGKANRVTGPATVPGAHQPPAPRNPPEGTPPCIKNGTPGYGAPGCTYEVHEFEVKPGEENGKFIVNVTWESDGNDFDVYVYLEDEDGTLTEVTSAASGGTSQENAIKFAPASGPIEPGNYVIFVDNWASDDPAWKGFVSFEPYVPINVLPIAAIGAPDLARPGEQVTFSAAGSRDPDGTLTDYSWDFDGNGSYETPGGTNATAQRAFDRGPVHVGLRVVDNRGGIAHTNKTVAIGSGSGTGTGGGTTDSTRTATLTVRRNQPLRSRVRATLDCFRACSARSEARIGSRVVGRGSRRLREAGTIRLDTRLTAAARRRLARTRRVRVTLRVRITEAGRTRTLVRRVTLTR